MGDWDANSDLLKSNLTRVLRVARYHAERRDRLSIQRIREWHADIMQDLRVPRRQDVGAFRGEPGLERCEVIVGDEPGVPAARVAQELRDFETKLVETLDALDELIPTTHDLEADDIAAVIDLRAWAHSAWVRIHPFANGNGRTARLIANCVAMRYGLPPFVRLRPRPESSYGAAARESMRDNWEASIPVFRRMFIEVVRPRT